MKPTLISILIPICIPVLFSSPQAVHAQVTKGQSELSLGIGVETLYELGSRYTDGENKDYPHAPAYSFAYRYYLTKRLSLGLSMCYQQLKDYDLDYDLRYHNRHVISSFSFIAPEITFCYLTRIIGEQKKELRLYGLFCGGIAWYNSTYTNDHNRILPALQLTPIGIRYGKQLAVYAEAGFGNKGLVNAGLSYCFSKKKLKSITQ